MLKTAFWPLAVASMIGIAAVPVVGQQAAAPATSTTTTTATPAAGDAAATTTTAPTGDAAATTAAAGTPVAFPSGQARRGNQVFQQSCAGCHGDRLQGMLENPPLSGPDFQSHWWGQPVEALFTFISTNMPLDAPGSLTPKQYADLTAFLLSKNGIAGTDTAADLPGDATALQAMMLPAVGTAPAATAK